MRSTDLLLLAVTFASMTSGITGCEQHGCTFLYVPSRATIDRTVGNAFDVSKPLRVELCRNDACESADFTIDANANGSARLCNTGDSPLGVDEGCSLVRNAEGTWRFVASWMEKDASFRSGDRYRATLTSESVTLVTVDASATYAESEPNGEGCGVTKTATL